MFSHIRSYWPQSIKPLLSRKTSFAIAISCWFTNSIRLLLFSWADEKWKLYLFNLDTYQIKLYLHCHIMLDYKLEAIVAFFPDLMKNESYISLTSTLFTKYPRARLKHAGWGEEAREGQRGDPLRQAFAFAPNSTGGYIGRDIWDGGQPAPQLLPTKQNPHICNHFTAPLHDFV